VDVDVRTVATVIADWTGVPLSSLMKDEQTELLSLENEIGKRVVGQDVALNAIAQRLRAAKTGLTSENGPQGVFLLVGRAVSVRPKPRWRWRMRCTAARNH
jgi:type VI secretion system protein VasG